MTARIWTAKTLRCWCPLRARPACQSINRLTIYCGLSDDRRAANSHRGRAGSKEAEFNCCVHAPCLRSPGTSGAVAQHKVSPPRPGTLPRRAGQTTGRYTYFDLKLRTGAYPNEMRRLYCHIKKEHTRQGSNNASGPGNASLARAAQEFPRRMELTRNDLRCGPAFGTTVHPSRFFHWRREAHRDQSEYHPR